MRAWSPGQVAEVEGQSSTFLCGLTSVHFTYSVSKVSKLPLGNTTSDHNTKHQCFPCCKAQSGRLVGSAGLAVTAGDGNPGCGFRDMEAECDLSP